MKQRPTRSTLFPYTTLFRSRGHHRSIRLRRNTVAGRRFNRSAWTLFAHLVERPPRDQNKKCGHEDHATDRKSTRLNSSHVEISYAVFCLKKKTSYITYTFAT